LTNFGWATGDGLSLSFPASTSIIPLDGFVNGPGPDLVLFELGHDTPDRILISAATSKTYSGIGTGSSNYSLLLSNAIPVVGYNATVGAISSLSALETTGFGSPVNNTGLELFGLAVDLSDLGVAEGASVTGITIRAVDSATPPDLAMVAGLPAIPEPGGLGVLAFAGLLALRRRCSGRTAQIREQVKLRC
jgi:hypothetical protein